MVEQQRDSEGRPAFEAETITTGACHAGDIISTGTVRIRGRLESDIRAERIVVASTATVDGTLLARTVHIDGTVNGPIVADRVTLGPTARIKGNISYETVNIAAGASIIGYCLDRTRRDPAAAGREDVLALPFNRIAPSKRKPHLPIEAFRPRHGAAAGAGSMKAVWRAYQEGRTQGQRH